MEGERIIRLLSIMKNDLWEQLNKMVAKGE